MKKLVFDKKKTLSTIRQKTVVKIVKYVIGIHQIELLFRNVTLNKWFMVSSEFSSPITVIIFDDQRDKI